MALNKKRLQMLLKSWDKDENNIFRNYIDALIGGLVLVVIPFVSLISVYLVENINFFSYLFPLISISAAEIYDAYGRMDDDSNNIKGNCGITKNKKLSIRILTNILAIIITVFLYVLRKYTYSFLIIPIILLVANGLLIIREFYKRIVLAIKLKMTKFYKRR